MTDLEAAQAVAEAVYSYTDQVTEGADFGRDVPAVRALVLAGLRERRMEEYQALKDTAGVESFMRFATRKSLNISALGWGERHGRVAWMYAQWLIEERRAVAMNEGVPKDQGTKDTDPAEPGTASKSVEDVIEQGGKTATTPTEGEAEADRK